MRKISMALVIVVISFYGIADAQPGGSLVGSLGMGITSAQSDFADNVIGFSGGSGFGIEAGLQFYLWGGFSVGGFINYMRFGSSYSSTRGRLSFDYSQMGGKGKMNLIRLSDGVIYLTGGGGVFTPSAHYYIPDNSFNETGDERGYFGYGGFGLSSFTDHRVIYELEFRYNFARADYRLDDITSNVWDFVYLGMNISFSSKGKGSPPRY